MAEGFDEMGELANKYPEYDTMKYSQLEDTVDNFWNKLVDMDDRAGTDVDVHNETNDHLKYAESVLQDKPKVGPQ